MLQEAIKARLPIIGVATDDPINAEAVLQSIAEPKLVSDFSNIASNGPVITGRVYWTFDDKAVTLTNYRRFQKSLSSLIVFNAKPSDLAFDGGLLHAPETMIYKYLEAFTKTEQRQKIIRILKGLSLKACSDVVQLTIARTGGLKPEEVRRTRLGISGSVQGLIPLESESEAFYVWPKELKEWFELNQKYFESAQTPQKLVPRGLCFDGPPGTGKTMAARAIAHSLGIPLYRLDVSQALNRYIGESENRVQRSLMLIEQEAPCVLLIDEVEKIFGYSDDNGVVTRILSTLLWWLSEHQGRVLTMLTTNKLQFIPPELYRPGRMDKVITLGLMKPEETVKFAKGVFQDVVGVPPDTHQVIAIIDQLTKKPEWSPSDVSIVIYNLVKTNNWVELV
jgi:hypothetical protein